MTRGDKWSAVGKTSDYLDATSSSLSEALTERLFLEGVIYNPGRFDIFRGRFQRFLTVASRQSIDPKAEVKDMRGKTVVRDALQIAVQPSTYSTRHQVVPRWYLRRSSLQAVRSLT